VKKESMPKCLACDNGTTSLTGYCPCTSFQHEMSRQKRRIKKIQDEAIEAYKLGLHPKTRPVFLFPEENIFAELTEDPPDDK
jgi:hypothetical protein